MLHLGNNQDQLVHYSLIQAQATLLHYCLGTRSVPLMPWQGADATVPRTADRYVGAYLFYDAQQSPDGRLHPSQLVAANGLNAGIDARTRATAAGVIEYVNEQLDKLPLHLRLEDVDLTGDVEDGSPRQSMERAYYALTAVPDIGMTRVSKVLHLVRPNLYPVIDNKTKVYLQPDDQRWLAVQHDLVDEGNRSTFEVLEAYVASDICQGSVDRHPLTRLRIHDILLWCHATDRRQDVTADEA